MIDDIVFSGIQYYELELNDLPIAYPIAIIFGTVNSTDIVQTERIIII